MTNINAILGWNKCFYGAGLFYKWDNESDYYLWNQKLRKRNKFGEGIRSRLKSVGTRSNNEERNKEKKNRIMMKHIKKTCKILLT